MQALINWNVVSSRLRRYLFNNGTESNWLCRRGERAGRQGSTNSFLFLNLTQLFLEGGRSAIPCFPSAYFALSKHQEHIRVHVLGHPYKGPSRWRPWLCPLAFPRAAVLFCFCRMPPSVLTSCCSTAPLPATGVEPSSVFLAVKNWNYPYK